MDIIQYLDRTALWAMSLVAARFRAVANNILYHDIFLYNSRLSRLLVSIKVNPFNVTRTKCIHLWLEAKHTPPEIWDDLFVLLTHMQNLERLHVSPVGYPKGVEWYPPPMPRLQILQFKRLRMTAQLAESLVALPSLKCLKMGQVPPFSVLATDLRPISEHLKTIMNNLVEFEGSLALTMYLRDYGKLKYLSISLCECTEEEWRCLHQAAGATLQFLRIRSLDLFESHQLLSRASKFSALRYLGVLPLNVTEPFSATVRHIFFGRCG